MAVALSAILNDHIHKLNMTPFQEKVVKQIIRCQTPSMGYHTLECTNKSCSNEEKIYNSCKSIYCPKCRTFDQLKWTVNRMNEVLPVEYAHLVFNAHTCIRPLIQYNSKRGLNAMSKAVSRALKNTFSIDNNQIGAIAVIHTNTQLLNYSPHIHCLIPKGYLNSDKTKWIQISKNLKTFREKLSIQFKISLLRELEKKNKELKLHIPENHIMTNPKHILEYAKKCRFQVQVQDNVKDVHHTLKYLGDKTKKVIIDDHRIINYKDNTVTLSWSDRRVNKIKETEMDALLFLKRFMLHILPSRFTRVRYYGFLSNSCKKKSITLCRKLISEANLKVKQVKSKVKEYTLSLIDKITKPAVCSVCYKGLLVCDGL